MKVKLILFMLKNGTPGKEVEWKKISVRFSENVKIAKYLHKYGVL